MENKVGIRIRELRKRAGMTQAELAAKIRVLKILREVLRYLRYLMNLPKSFRRRRVLCLTAFRLTTVTG